MIPETQPALIIASWRCGGTFLSHCLSNHPDIFCVRGEALHYRNIWRKMAKNPVNILKCVMGQHHYMVSMGKVSYTQAFDDAVWPYIVEVQPKVIWLRRDNLVRQAVSLILVKLYHKGITKKPVHTFENQPPAPVKLKPEVVMDQIESLKRADDRAKKRCEQLKDVLPLTYTDVVGGEMESATHLLPATTITVCEFLGVDPRMLESNLKPVNPYHLSETVKNWGTIKAAIEKTEFAEMVKDE